MKISKNRLIYTSSKFRTNRFSLNQLNIRAIFYKISQISVCFYWKKSKILVNYFTIETLTLKSKTS